MAEATMQEALHEAHTPIMHETIWMEERWAEILADMPEETVKSYIQQTAITRIAAESAEAFRSVVPSTDTLGRVCVEAANSEPSAKNGSTRRTVAVLKRVKGRGANLRTEDTASEDKKPAAPAETVPPYPDMTAASQAAHNTAETTRNEGLAGIIGEYASDDWAQTTAQEFPDSEFGKVLRTALHEQELDEDFAVWQDVLSGKTIETAKTEANRNFWRGEDELERRRKRRGRLAKAAGVAAVTATLVLSPFISKILPGSPDASKPFKGSAAVWAADAMLGQNAGLAEDLAASPAEAQAVPQALQPELETPETEPESPTTSVAAAFTDNTTEFTNAAVEPEIAAPELASLPADCEHYRPIVAQYDWPVEPAMLTMMEESGCNPRAISPTNDYGLFQLHGIRELDPEKNIKIAYQKYRQPRIGTMPNFSAWYAVCTTGDNPQPKFNGIICQ